MEEEAGFSEIEGAADSATLVFPSSSDSQCFMLLFLHTGLSSCSLKLALVEVMCYNYPLFHSHLLAIIDVVLVLCCQVQSNRHEAHYYDFHIVYSASYRVPVLYFRAYCSGMCFSLSLC